MTVLSPEFPLQTSDVACIDINKNDMWFVGNTIERSWYKLGNATAECYKNLEVSQSRVGSILLGKPIIIGMHSSL